MEARTALRQAGERAEHLLRALARQIPDMQRRAVLLDAQDAFPTEDIGLLRDLGALAAPLPTALGGLGWGTEPEAALDLMDALRLLGRGNLSVGRLYEAHVNALRLVTRDGTAAQTRTFAIDAMAGHLFALWVTDPPETPLCLRPDFVLDGCKAPGSGAGHVTRALVTAQLPSGNSCLLVIEPPGPECTDISGWETQGMRAARSARVMLDGIRVAPGAMIGSAGAYLRQPDFSAGAWRTSAVTLGGLEALVGELRRHLVIRNRDGDPYQRARVGEALIAQETARLWVRQAAGVAEAQDGDAQDIVTTVNLARIAVETACLDAMRIVQRGLGLVAFRRGELAELLLRDLATYLRQPATDEILAEAAAHFMQRDLPSAAHGNPQMRAGE